MPHVRQLAVLLLLALTLELDYRLLLGLSDSCFLFHFIRQLHKQLTLILHQGYGKEGGDLGVLSKMMSCKLFYPPGGLKRPPQHGASHHPIVGAVFLTNLMESNNHLG